MNCKEKLNSVITFSICGALTNKILAIILSSIRFTLYLTTFILLKTWYKETKNLESFCIFQFVYEIIILLTAILMLIFSKYLNRKWVYRSLRIHTVIITIYLFLNFFIDMCIFAGIKYKEFPDLYRFKEDPIFNYTDDNDYFLEKFIIKNTQKIDISLINETIFNITYLVKDNGQIYVPDPQFFQINFTDEMETGLKPYQKRHRSEFNRAMVLVLINIILDILSFFLWNSIRFKHKKLIQNRVIKKFGRKIVYTGYVKVIIFVIIVICYSKKEKEKNAIKEVRDNENYIPDVDVKKCDLFWKMLMESFALLGSLITFIVLMVQEDKEDFTTRGMNFPFALTFFGDGLYSYLVIFLIIIFIIGGLGVGNADIFINHHKHMHNTYIKRYGTSILFTFGLVSLFFSICGVIGSLFLIVGEIDSNGNLYIKTACKDSDISCYGLFKFAPSFPLDNRKYSKIFYYIYIKKISKSAQIKNIKNSIIMLLIYFCEFYVILFGNFLDFNFDKEKFGKCLVQDYIEKDNSELNLLDDICAKIKDNEQYYKNSLNDSYFNIFKNDNTKTNDKNEKNEKNEKKEIQIVENNNKSQTSGRVNQTNITTTVIRITTNLKTNNK